MYQYQLRSIPQSLSQPLPWNLQVWERQLAILFLYFLPPPSGFQDTYHLRHEQRLINVFALPSLSYLSIMFTVPVPPVSVGSNIFFALALCSISALVLLLLRRFLTLRATPAYLIVPVFLALALPASVVLLVPIDLASSSRDGTGPKAIWLPDRVVLVCWRIAYWLIFMLTW